VNRLAVRDDDVLERQVEHRPERGHDSFLVPGRRPDAKLAPALGQGVGEDERALLGEPERRLVPAAAVVERDQAAGQLASRFDRLELRLGNVVAPEEARSERPGAVAIDDQVDASDVVRLEDGRHRRRPGIEPRPYLLCARTGEERVEHGHLAA
jgi:hypothetical protein